MIYRTQKGMIILHPVTYKNHHTNTATTSDGTDGIILQRVLLTSAAAWAAGNALVCTLKEV